VALLRGAGASEDDRRRSRQMTATNVERGIGEMRLDEARLRFTVSRVSWWDW
jgi:hypothetical protein